MIPYLIFAWLIACLCTYAGHCYIETRFEINHDLDEFVIFTSFFWPVGFFYIVGKCFSKLAEKHRIEAETLSRARVKAEESKHRLQLSSTEDLLEELSLRDDLRYDTVKKLRG